MFVLFLKIISYQSGQKRIKKTNIKDMYEKNCENENENIVRGKFVIFGTWFNLELSLA